MSKVPPGRRCESDEGSADGLGDGAGAGSPDGTGIGDESELSDSADGIPSECGDGDDGLVGTVFLRKESRLLILSRMDSNLCFAIAEEAIARVSSRR